MDKARYETYHGEIRHTEEQCPDSKTIKKAKWVSFNERWGENCWIWLDYLGNICGYKKGVLMIGYLLAYWGESRLGWKSLSSRLLSRVQPQLQVFLHNSSRAEPPQARWNQWTVTFTSKCQSSKSYKYTNAFEENGSSKSYLHELSNECQRVAFPKQVIWCCTCNVARNRHCSPRNGTKPCCLLQVHIKHLYSARRVKMRIILQC